MMSAWWTAANTAPSMMTIIAADSMSDEGDGGCTPASKPMRGAKMTKAIANMGKAIVVDGGFVLASIVVLYSVLN
ncbi:MAG: hypothetical protein WA905_09230 [Pseudolabrys sp.]